MIRNSVFFTCLFLISSAAHGIVYEYEKDKFNPVGAPDEVFSGLYAGFGLELMSNECKYEILTVGTRSLYDGILAGHKASIRNYPYSFLGIIGFGGVYNRSYYAGVESELFFRRGGGTKEKDNIKILTKNTYGFNFRLRGGYIFKQHGLMIYGTISADRSINNISAKKQDGGYTGFESFGSYHPSIGIGLEKKVRDNWGIRGEFVYTIGIWDDTGKYLRVDANSTNANSPRFRATANKKSIKLSVVKYL